jgi:hypothetical protein
MPNRLATSRSLYLRQHADNPVDWYEWCDEAFARAERENLPIFLSVGYSSCHWCHVMAHECFEDPEVAEKLNRGYVSIKLDREQHPEIDETYMTAVQLSRGQGGWPMSVFLLPDQRPFFAGTYFPKLDRPPHPGFLSILDQISEAWKGRRGEIEAVAEQFDQLLHENANRLSPDTLESFDWTFVERAVSKALEEFDEEHGGFGGAPKFPPHGVLRFLLSYLECGQAQQTENVQRIVIQTLKAMAWGGIYDAVEGGFHRYSTDARWHLPHFEKMLYDQVLLIPCYVRAAAWEPEFLEVANQTLSFLKLRMKLGDGFYGSALNADVEGHEGLTYLWSEVELRQHLGAQATAFCETFGVEQQGNYLDEATHQRTGLNVLHRTRPQDHAEELGTLASVRARRPQPELDPRAIVGYQGLALVASAMMEDPDAERLAEALLDLEAEGGFLPHSRFEGMGDGRGYLEDYAACALGMYSLGTRIPRYVDDAVRLTEAMIALFWDDQADCFRNTQPGHVVTFGRTVPMFDQPTPSGNALALECLIRAGRLDLATRLVNANVGWLHHAPAATASFLAAALRLLDPSFDGELGSFGVRFVGRSLSQRGDQWIGEIEVLVPEGWHLDVDQLSVTMNRPLRHQLVGDRLEVFFGVARPIDDRMNLEIAYVVCKDDLCLPRRKAKVLAF